MTYIIHQLQAYFPRSSSVHYSSTGYISGSICASSKKKSVPLSLHCRIYNQHHSFCPVREILQQQLTPIPIICQLYYIPIRIFKLFHVKNQSEGNG